MNVQEALQACTIEGNFIKPPTDRLDVATYAQMKDRILKIGGKWKGGKVQAFEFTVDPSDRLADIAGGAKRNIQQETQFFETPEKIANHMVKWLELFNDESVLEPSAGHGALIDAIRKTGVDVNIFYMEKDYENAAVLNKKYNYFEHIYNLNGKTSDFLEMEFVNKFDRIIANPPFKNNQDIKHIRKMYDLLRDNGSMVTICSTSYLIPSNKEQKEFAEWLEDIGALFFHVPKGEFKESGTNVSTIMIKIRKYAKAE